MQLFYAPTLVDNFYVFDEQESKHCVRVLRKTIGDTIHLTDGKGKIYLAVVEDCNPKRCKVRVEQTEIQPPLPYTLQIAVAPTKCIDRYEWFLEKATEVGFDKVVPLKCTNSERTAVKQDRSLKVVTSAVKQSLKAYHPEVEPITPFKEFVARDFGSAQKFIAHCEPNKEKVLLRDAVKRHGDVVVLIGPEGDFSLEEIEQAHKYGFLDISLGKSRLRTETAALAAVMAVAFVNE